ncbi:hypothetical protein BT96DRAFT_993405 [Gymnopus androsaceus JB14]|uniref:Uncharacterized protein n=1 Tax=Gymnopus androsaceus JB14 TaxID=1447944 RepID=A0A6A4HQ31_9AGAR|nr:hypothetical protein BT96DRAFT_993405 [Gymnopus androsaceus JB14]
MLVDWLDDNGIFASKLILEVISNPGLLLDTQKCGDLFIAGEILKGYGIFASVESWLAEEYEAGEVQDVSFMLSDVVSNGLSQMAKSTHRSHCKSGSLQRSQNCHAALFIGIPCVPAQSPLSNLLPYVDGLRIDMLGFMIWEALNKQKGDLAVGESSLYCLIHGEDPITNSKSAVRDPDHYQPV